MFQAPRFSFLWHGKSVCKYPPSWNVEAFGEVFMKHWGSWRDEWNSHCCNSCDPLGVEMGEKVSGPHSEVFCDEENLIHNGRDGTSLKTIFMRDHPLAGTKFFCTPFSEKPNRGNWSKLPYQCRGNQEFQRDRRAGHWTTSSRVPAVVGRVRILDNPVRSLETQLPPRRSSGGARSTKSPENHGGRVRLSNLKITSSGIRKKTSNCYLVCTTVQCMWEEYRSQSQQREAWVHWHRRSCAESGPSMLRKKSSATSGLCTPAWLNQVWMINRGLWLLFAMCSGSRKKDYGRKLIYCY